MRASVNARGMDARFDGGVLGRQPEAVEPDGAEDGVTLHRALADEEVTEGVVADVALVGRPARVRVHAEHVVRRARVVVVDLVGALLGPAPLPFGLDGLGVVLLRHIDPGYRGTVAPQAFPAGAVRLGHRWRATSASGQSRSGRDAPKKSARRLSAWPCRANRRLADCFQHGYIPCCEDPARVVLGYPRGRLEGAMPMTSDLARRTGRSAARARHLLVRGQAGYCSSWSGADPVHACAGRRYRRPRTGCSRRPTGGGIAVCTET